MVDRDGLENRCACKRTVGSNPTPSAKFACPTRRQAFRRIRRTIPNEKGGEPVALLHFSPLSIVRAGYRPSSSSSGGLATLSTNLHSPQRLDCTLAANAGVSLAMAKIGFLNTLTDHHYEPLPER